MTEYTKLQAGDMLQAVGDDAVKWADAFLEVVPGADRELMVGWFANAIENAWSLRTNRFIHDGEAFLEFIESISSQRLIWHDIAVEHPEQPEATSIQ